MFFRAEIGPSWLMFLTRIFLDGSSIPVSDDLSEVDALLRPGLMSENWSTISILRMIGTVRTPRLNIAWIGNARGLDQLKVQPSDRDSAWSVLV
jgi:hypothetical protein